MKSRIMAVTFSQPQDECINVFVRSSGKVSKIDAVKMQRKEAPQALTLSHLCLLVIGGCTLQTHCLWVDPYNESVADTKKRMNDNSVWTWNGKLLEDDAVLADYEMVGEGMTIHAFPRQRGGCFMVSLSIIFIIICALVGSTCTCGMSLVVVPFLMPLLFVLPLFCL